MFSFYWPYFGFLLPLPLAIWFILPKYRAGNIATSARLLFSNINVLKEAFGITKTTTKESILPLILMYGFWACIVFALMRPQIVNSSSYVNQKGYDILLAVDVSLSMQALDFATKVNRVNRLDVTKNVIDSFIKKRSTDRLGLILFGEHAYLQLPLTHDTIQVSKMLYNAEPGIAGPSTAIGDAIGVAIRAFQKKSDGGRILILLTDGADTSSNIPPLSAAHIAKEEGVKIYTVGIGKKGEVPFPNQFGGVSMVEVGMDEELLTEIANITGGIYFKAEDDASLEKIYAKIDELEKIDLDVKEYKIREPLYRYPLVAGAIIFLVIGLIPLYKNRNFI